MTIQTIPRPSETAHNRPDLEESPNQLDGNRNGTLTTVVLGAVVVGAILAAVIAIALATAGDGRSVSDGSWEQAEFRRMLALDQHPVDTSSDFVERQRQLRQAGGSSVSSFDAAEFGRHNRLNPTGDTSNEEAEFARQRALAPESDNSDEVAEFRRMTRLGR